MTRLGHSRVRSLAFLLAAVGTCLMLACTGHGRRSAHEPMCVSSPLRGTAEAATPPLSRAKPAGPSPNETCCGDTQPQNPDARGRQRYQFRAGPDGTIPPGLLLAAKDHVDQMPAVQVPGQITRDAGIWHWEWMGPGNIGGRVRSILIDPKVPDRMWVGGVSGGIWRSTSGGASWNPINDFLPSLAVASLAMDATDSETLYAGTGEPSGSASRIPGAGILKSTDGGLTWNQLPATAAWGAVSRIATHPTQYDVLLAAVQSSSGVFKSEDGGATWTQVLTTANTCWDVKIDAGTPSNVLAGTSAEVWMSTAGGGAGSWVEMTTGAPNKLPADGGRCEVAFGIGNVWYVSMDRNGGEVWRSTDLGATWHLRNTGTNYFMTGSGNSQGSYDNALWVAPDSADTIIVGGIDLYRSTDGGTTLTRISTWQNYDDGTSAHADQHIIVPHPDYTANNPIVYVGNDGGIQRNDNVLDLVGNVRNSWVNLANGLGVTQFYTGAASPLGTVFLGGTQDNSVLRYIEGDGTDEWYQGFTGDGGYCAVVGSSIMYSATQYLCIRKSTDGGNSWTVSVNGLTDVDTDGDGQCGPNSLAAFVAPFILDPNDNQTLLAGAVNLWATSDAAANWTQIRTPLASTAQCSALAIAETNSLRAWAGYTDGTVSYTPVNLLNWVDVDDGITPIPELPITDIAISPINADEVFVTIGGQQSNSVWYTQDSGITWEQRTGSGQTALPAIQVNTITFHPEKPSWVYVGTDIGIFASEDKGLTWNKTPRFGDVGTDGPVYTEVDDLFWYAGSGGAMLVAATHGRGMFRVRPLGTVYVDWRNAGDPDENGTLAHPFNRVVEGHDVAGGGTTISIASGQYEEDNPLVLYKAVTLEATGGSVVIR